MTIKYGFIGLGHLGQKMAGCLLRGGLPLTVFDIDKAAMAPLVAKGASAATSAAALAAEVDAFITCLPSPVVSEKILSEILPHCRPKTSWIETSTLDRDSIMRLAKMAATHGVETLECPVTGGVHLAEVGKVTVLVGGPRDLFKRHEAALRLIGSRVFLMGDVGAAAIIKVITNMLAFINLVGCAEALMLAKRGGLDLATAYEAIRASSGNSFVHETEGQLILNGSYDIDFTMDLALKDLGFALGFGREFG
ncbi:MAG: NAD(P)-dependent oxidoreductase, partial [Alphaproteobacteria bacterium]|nr:NAD(P)-dependent oxidoreductase [Alphaproteobacteria bacterium]